MVDYEDDDSGPYCRHWDDPVDCTEVCIVCNHECREHRTGECLAHVNGFSTNDSPAVDGECDCDEFKD
jgi:hypothetical protein